MKYGKQRDGLIQDYLHEPQLQKQDFEKAKGFLEKAMEFNPDMEESKKALMLLDDLLLLESGLCHLVALL